MKALLLSIFDGLFTKETNNHAKNDSIDKIFITETDPDSNKTLIIEEDKNSVWAYLLSSDKERIDFVGFLCSVVSPKLPNFELQESIINGETSLATANLANQYTYVKDLKRKNISIHWKESDVTVCIKNEVYLLMDFESKTGFSKGLSTDSQFGKKLENYTLRTA